MIEQFSEVAFLTDRDLSRLLLEIDNETLQLALYDCDDRIKSRIFAQFSYMGFKMFEMDRKSIGSPPSEKVQWAQQVILECLNCLIDERELDDYPNTKHI